MASSVYVDSRSFDDMVLQSSKAVIVDFWAPWCAPCRMIAPHLEALAEEYGDSLVVAKLNTDENPDIAMRYQVSGIPTLMIFRGGEVVERIVGAVPPDFIKEKLSPFL
jgi:thioredoxin 1